MEFFVPLTFDASGRFRDVRDPSKGAKGAAGAIELLKTYWPLYDVERWHNWDLLFFFCIAFL